MSDLRRPRIILFCLCGYIITASYQVTALTQSWKLRDRKGGGCSRHSWKHVLGEI
ncbi:hypothetical protein HanIR_Chr06g0280291 [Helianthus annuus]|nr:hypothetical protein HanIR_Chr06g0280291 [Helianthus annuus]